jgi:hypothetical protein
MLGKRTLFSWQEAAPQKPLARPGTVLWEEQNAEYEANRWTDALCKCITEIPVVRGMLETNKRLVEIPISFVENDPHNRFAYYDIINGEIVLNATAIKNYSSYGDEEYSDLMLNCIFSILHELRHAHQYSFRCDPWLKTYATENPKLVSVYDVLVREADATAFALTGMYDLVANPEILNLDQGSFDDIMERIPESASRDAFVESIKDNAVNFYNGEAQQRAFSAYFSKKNRPLVSEYVDMGIRAAQEVQLNYRMGGPISEAFKMASSQEVFSKTYSFLKGMPSIEPDEDSTLIERHGYLGLWPLSVKDLTGSITQDQLVRMGFDGP